MSTTEKRRQRSSASDSLTGVSRSDIADEQLHAITNVMPATVTASLLIAMIFLFAAYGTPGFPQMVMWLSLLVGMLAIEMSIWASSRKGVKARGDRILKRAVIRAAIMGSIWGVAPVIMFMNGVYQAEFLIGAGITAILFGSVFLYAALPEMVVSFALPLLIGVAWGSSHLEMAYEAVIICVVLASFLAIKLMSIGHTRDLLQNLIIESKSHEQRDIISLLLREFEENSSDWLWELDGQGRIDRVSARFAEAASTCVEDLTGKDFRSFLLGASVEGESLATAILDSIENRETVRDALVKLDLGQGERWWRISGKPMFDRDESYRGYVGTASDITSELRAETQINFLAHHDALTGLLNRAKFTDTLNQAVSRLERYGSPFTVMYFDLDQFKSVNDTRGHLTGDKVLLEVASRIRNVTRESDSVARLGGDEFALIMGAESTAEEIAALAARLVADICLPYEVGSETVSIGVSVGIAMAPKDGTRPDQILRNADLALYRAKAEGKGTYRFFESKMDADVRERRMLEIELRQALVDGEFVLYYQPLTSTLDREPTGFEALIRWNHPIRGLVPPGEFIPIAEEAGLIQQIGDWTILEACRAAKSWPADTTVAVNISAKHFQMTDITAVVSRALKETGLAASRLEIEITESLFLQNPEQVISKLNEVKALGISIAMDDFGTGYSSLSYLLKFPFDKIKIDRSFVTASSSGSTAREILRTIVALGKSLNIRVTAEGVETIEQVEFLCEIACNQLQGFYFARPLGEDALSNYLAAHFPGAPAPASEGDQEEFRDAS